MFRVPEFPADLFVTRPVVDAIVENGLQGYAFDVVPLSQEGAGTPDPAAWPGEGRGVDSWRHRCGFGRHRRVRHE